jgi:hypothetical protein
VSSPLDLAPTTTPLPKFKDHLPKFSGNGTISVNEHLIAFSNACHNIGANENDTCMRLFVNSLEGKVVTDFFELPPKIFTTWDELSYWFKSTYGQPQSPTWICLEITTILSIIKVKLLNLSICVSPNYTIRFQKSLDLIIKLH